MAKRRLKNIVIVQRASGPAGFTAVTQKWKGKRLMTRKAGFSRNAEALARKFRKQGRKVSFRD